jgi:segregation and condensation protein A
MPIAVPAAQPARVGYTERSPEIAPVLVMMRTVSRPVRAASQTHRRATRTAARVSVLPHCGNAPYPYIDKEMIVPDTYTVRLEDFEGPLDLLLYLIRKEEVDLHNIPIASITEQYISHVRQLETLGAHRIDIDTAGEFLVMAATLMEIKSRMLMPTPPEAPGTEPEKAKAEREDPRAELVKQLLEYKKYRDAANALELRGDEWRKRYPTARIAVDDASLQQAIDAAPDVELDDVDLLDLVEAFRKIADTVNFERLGDHQVTYDDTPIELHAEDIVSRLRSELSPEDANITRGIPLQEMFKGRRKPEMVGLFLALLELIRNRRVRVVQDKIDGFIHVHLREDDEPATAAE